jgi:Ca2+-binding RTX toxin-like protein
LGWNGTAENLFYYNGSATSQVTSNLDVYNPKISGDKLVYSKFNGTNYSLQLYNGTSKTTTQLSSSLSYSGNFEIDGNSVAWEEKSTVPNSYDVFLKLYNGTSTANIATTSSDFTLAGNKVAYVAYDPNYDNQLFLYDGTLSTPTNTQITAEELNYYNLAIAGNTFISNGNGLLLTRPSTKPILSINNVTVVEGQTSPQNAVLAVTLSAASTVPVTVQYTTSSGSAYDGSDYTTTTGTLSFAAGELSKNISVPILNDDYSESDETFTVKLSNAVGAVFVPNQNSGTVTITDTLQASVTTILPAGIENLTLTGTANINGTGNSNSNKIQGNSGNNVLDGQGGYGYEQLIGGAGNDTYIVSWSIYSTTNITENANEGVDTVQFSSDMYYDRYTLANNLENLTFTGTIGNTGYGNSLDNVITGNSGDDYLDGVEGNDTLNGGGGNDTLLGDDPILGGVGNDTLNGGTGNDYLSGGDGNDILNGDSDNDLLYGNAGNDTLNGGTGNDNLNGGTGDDIYIVDSTTDYAYENANEGTDTIQSSVTFSLATVPNIENLTLTGSSTINGTGNTANNVLTGNTANNLLSGDTGNDILTGAAGKDTLTGGAGIDKFGYKTLTDSLLANYDLITDFNATTGNDLFLVTTARAGFTTGLTVATLDTAGIGAKLTTTNFAANFAAQFTFTSGTTTRTFVAINDATAGFNASTDSIVEVTGLTGTLVIGNFVTA